MHEVLVDLHPGDTGQYLTEIVVGPGERWASLAAESATIHLDAATAGQPGAGVQRLVFRQAVASSLGLAPLASKPRLLLAYVYRPKDHAEILAFDRRITDRYTSFFSTVGEQYSGTFDVDGLPEPCIGEFSVLDAPSGPAWMAKQAAIVFPDDVEAIVEECGLLQDRSFERFAIWLTRRD